MHKMKNKKTIIYLHRYPIEEEAFLCPATRSILDLLTKKYNVIYISLKSKKIDKELRKGLIIRELPFTIDRKDPKDKWIKTILWYFCLPKIKKIILKSKPSFIVHKEQMPFIPSFLSRLNIKLLQDIGDWWWTTLLCKYNLEKISEKIENIEIRDWNKSKNLILTAHSKAEASMIAKRGMDPNRIFVINHPSSKETFRPVDASEIKKKLNLTKDNWIIAVHGITHPSKDYNLLLNWWSKISKEHKNWILLNIGGTTGEKWYRKRLKQLKIEDNAIITGWISNPEKLNKYLNAADCLLVTRKNNLANQGLIPSSLWHSMSIGKPLIITGLPGLSEHIQDRKSGYSYIPDNYESFRSTLEHIYNNPQEAKKVAKNGIKRGEKVFNTKRCTKKYFNLIDDLISEKEIVKP